MYSYLQEMRLPGVANVIGPSMGARYAYMGSRQPKGNRIFNSARAATSFDRFARLELGVPCVLPLGREGGIPSPTAQWDLFTCIRYPGRQFCESPVTWIKTCSLQSTMKHVVDLQTYLYKSVTRLISLPINQVPWLTKTCTFQSDAQAQTNYWLDWKLVQTSTL